MISYPSSHDVFDALGDKVIAALTGAVQGCRADLQAYRSRDPGEVADMSERGLASWLHDRMWAHCARELDGSHAQLTDSGGKREVLVRSAYRIRLKRHSPSGAIRAYPTSGALEFITQDQDLLDQLGRPIVNLTAGYVWDRAERTVGDAVISLRDGSFKDVIWMTTLPDSGATVVPTIPLFPTTGLPSAPLIEIRRAEVDDREGIRGS